MNEWTRRSWGPIEGWGAAAPDLLLVPGAGHQAAHFRGLVERLGCPAAALDLPGHGANSGALLTSISDMARAVESAVTHLGRPVALLGHSMGGAVVQETAIRGVAHLKGIILYSTGARLRVSPAIFQALEHRYDVHTRDSVRFFFAKTTPDAVLDAYLAMPHHPTNAPSLADFRATDAFDRMADVGKIAVPTLVLGGDDDALTPAKYQGFLADKIPGSERVVLAGTGHLAHLEAPDAFAAAVERFVGGLAARSN